MPTAIQRITIEDEKVELIVADDANSEAATTWLQLRVPRDRLDINSAALGLPR